MRQHHIDQAHRNYAVFQQLRGQYADWATTLLFYTAMQFVEAWLLQRLPTSSGSHETRANRMTRLGVPRDVFDAYETLRELSETARYRRWQAELDQQRLDSLFENEYRAVCQHFAAPAQITPP